MGRATMARTGALFAGSLALFAALSLLLPDSAIHDEPSLGVAAAGSGLTAVVLLAAYDRPPLWAFHVFVVLGTALASVAVYGWGTGSAFAPLAYLWIVVFSFYFFPLRSALAHLALAAVGYAVALYLEDPARSPLDGWLATVAALVIVGLFVGVVRERLSHTIASLTDAARRDPLTDLLNRRGFEEVFDVELERARRTDAPLSVIVGDLDRFKRINDEFGHPAGDDVLRRLARIVRVAKRSFDSAARVGGEEFALLAPDCDEHGAYMLAERVRADVERAYPGGLLTISFGVATYPLHGQSAEALLRAADQALYAAKRLGRNRSVISSAEVPGILAREPRAHGDAQVELASLLNLAEALDVRDNGNPAHCQRVGRFAELVAREMGLPPDSVERVRLAGILHDVGRVGIPDSLFSKRGPLNDDEWSWVRSHPEIGARLVETTDFDDIRAWILAHHERPDGNGYPDGRTGESVPLEARILAVADAYEAMTSDRSYRPAMSPETAAREMRAGAGEQFDADVVDALLRVV